MSRFFPRDVVHWGEQQLHPLRAFAIRTIEPAGITGLVLRVYRAIVLSAAMTAGVLPLLGALLVGVLFLCGMLTWHLGNYPLRRWPRRLAAFLVVEVVAELGMSSLLIAFGRERFGSAVATWADWWPMAGQTFAERAVVMVLFTGVLALTVQLVRRMVDKREPALAKHTL
ncbi:MAG: hypothetical protein V4617_10200 [Gemmatimonadota bacterium]